MGMYRPSNGGSQQAMPRRLAVVLAGTIGVVLLLQLAGLSSYRCSGTAVSHQDTAAAKAAGLSSSNAGSTSAAAQAAVHTRLDLTLGSTNAAMGGPPYSIPRLIHQTVVNKSRLSCQEKRVIDSWKRLNPNHTHTLWDDEDMRQFMLKHYPELVPVPYDLFVKGTERSDLWRVLVLHKYGGVYVDMDVECLKPIDEWNVAHGNDAAVLLGLENFDPKRTPHKAHVTNWAMAAAAGHPLLGRMPGVVVREIQKQYFALARESGELTGKLYEQGILDRTGPAALTTAMYEFYNSIGFDLNKLAAADFDSQQGVVAGGVRVLPVVSLSTGWEVANARSKGLGYTCADVARDKPDALVCHMFWGSWRSAVQWKFGQTLTYDNC